MKRVLIFATGADTGGQGWRIREGFESHAPDWHIDTIALVDKYMAYPAQVKGQAHARIVAARNLYDAADVVHLRLTLAGWEKMDREQGKPIVLHHHGTIFRASHLALADQARRIHAVQIASTIDLTMLEPDITWLPSPFALGPLRAIRERVYRPSERIRIAHAPTNRPAKHTRAFEAATKQLAREYPIDVDIIENVTWAQCLERKARADILFDQLTYGYGNNAVEAWAMGMPVVGGTTDLRVRARMHATFGTLPFLEATPSDLMAQLRALIESQTMRVEYAAMGTAHVERFHDEARVVAILRDLYTTAPPTVRAGRPMSLSGLERRRLASARWA